MKFIIPIFILSAIFSSCNGSVELDNNETNIEPIDSTYCNCTELTYDDKYNHFWRFNRRDGFTGKCEVFYPNGQLKESKIMVKGKNHGKFYYYYENGQIKEEKEFDMNFQTGELITYTESGEVKIHALYNRGKQVEILVNRPDL